MSRQTSWCPITPTTLAVIVVVASALALFVYTMFKLEESNRRKRVAAVSALIEESDKVESEPKIVCVDDVPYILTGTTLRKINISSGADLTCSKIEK